MSKMAAVLLRTADVMKGLLRPSYLAIKELMVSPTWRYSHQYPEQKHPDHPPQIILTGDGDYKEQFEIAGMCTIVCCVNGRKIVLLILDSALNETMWKRCSYYLFHLSLDVLLYYAEGFLPYLQIFFTEFYRKGHYDQCEIEGDTTDNIYTALLVRIK